MKKPNKIKEFEGTQKKEVEMIHLKGQLARALADYDNLVKRVDREKQELEFRSSLRLVLRLLPIVDNLRQALVHLKDAGLAITLGELENVLEEEGIEEVKVKKGDEFDPKLCEATEVVENSGEDNRIVEVVLSGWKFAQGPVIRHARVKVGKKKEVENNICQK